MDEEQKRLADELLFKEKKKASFVKRLYFGEFLGNLVFPYPVVNKEEKERTELFLQKVKDFANKEIDPDWIDRNSTIPEKVVKGLGQLGVLSMTIPKDYGGMGMSQYAYCRTAEELARRCGSTALFVNAHQSVGMKALVLFGTKEQKEKWLKPLATGEKIAAFSLTEPNAGSDAAGIETRAVYDPEKKVFRINGKKQWTTNGSIAEVLTVMARTEIDIPQGKQDKITAFLVTPDMPGFKVTAAALEKVGMRGSKTANLAFENMEVPEANVLGPLGGGLKVALTVLDFGRTTFGATCTGASKFLVEKAIQHARTRFQFKRPLASFPLVKEKIATISALAYAIEATTYMTAGFVDSGTEDFMLESAILKVFASDSLWQIIYETMQIYGGRSFFTDEPLERMMRDARLNMIGEGANEVMRAFIGLVGMRDVGMQFKQALDALQAPWKEYSYLWTFFEKNLSRFKVPQVPIKSALLQSEANLLGQAVRRFGWAVAKVLAKYREEIIEKQLVLNRIATSAIALYTMTAVLSKLDSEAPSENDLAIGKFYCQMALRSIDEALDNLFDPFDTEIERLSDKLCNL